MREHADEFGQMGWILYQPIWTKNENRIRHLPRVLKKKLGLKNLYWKIENRKLQRICVQHPKVCTVIQHDDGIHLSKYLRKPSNLVVFSTGGIGDIPLPLLCDPHDKPQMERDLLASFRGAVTHPSNKYPYREALHEAFTEDDSVIIDTNSERVVHDENTDYVSLMARSTFALCPRGYGRTSFRLYEAIRLGSIPVYIHDGTPWLPFSDEVDWHSFCVLTHQEEIKGLPDRLRSISKAERERMQKAGNDFSRNYLSYASCLDYIKRRLSKM